MNKLFIKKNGFTLIELLVVIFIIGVGITGAFSLITYNFSSARDIKNKLIAASLVQEGLEVARNIRDNDWHQDNSFGSSLPDGLYRIQYDSYNLIPLGTNPMINLSSEGVYYYGVGTPTLFKRTIKIEKQPNNVEIIVTSEVTWRGRGGDKILNAEMHLYDW